MPMVEMGQGSVTRRCPCWVAEELEVDLDPNSGCEHAHPMTHSLPNAILMFQAYRSFSSGSRHSGHHASGLARRQRATLLRPAAAYEMGESTDEVFKPRRGCRVTTQAGGSFKPSVMGSSWSSALPALPVPRPDKRITVSSQGFHSDRASRQAADSPGQGQRQRRIRLCDGYSTWDEDSSRRLPFRQLRRQAKIGK